MKINSIVKPFEVDGVILGKPETDGVVFFSYGSLLQVSLNTASMLRAKGTSATVISLPLLRPLDWDSVIPTILQNRLVVSIEEHRAPAPLQEMLCTLLNEAGISRRVLGLNLGDSFMKGALGPEAYRNAMGITPTKILEKIESILI